MSTNQSIQKSSDEVAIVIYDAPLPPKYFRLTKRFIRTLFIGAPVSITLLLLAFFIWGLGNRLKDIPAPTLPSVISEADTKLLTMEAEVKSLKESNRELSEKIAMGPTTTTSEDPYLMLIKKPYGMQNLMAENKVSLDQIEMVQGANKVNLKFQIISSASETRVTGHVLVFMVAETGLIIYPREANKSLTQGVKYSAGESFAVSRLRPTDAEFIHSLSGESVKFIIYIFNREGDILLIRETENFKVEARP
jgi:hypothetical protein